MSWDRGDGGGGEPSPGLGVEGAGWDGPGLVASPLTPPILGTSGREGRDGGSGIGSVRSRSPEKDKDRRKKAYGNLNGGQRSQGVTWDRAKASSARVNGYPSYQSRNQGFFARHMRRLSSVGLPSFAYGAQEEERLYGEKEKLGRGRIAWSWKGVGRSLAEVRHWRSEDWKELARRAGRMIARRKKQVMVLLFCILCIVLYNTPGKSK